MEAGSVFSLLAMLVVILLIITQPFYRKSSGADHEGASRPKAVSHEEEYRNILKEMRELKSDFKAGKLSEQDYGIQRKIMEDRAVHLLKEMSDPSAADPTTSRSATQHDIEEMVYERRMEREEQTSGFCPKCGRPMQKSDLFCPSCGEPRHLDG